MVFHSLSFDYNKLLQKSWQLSWGQFCSSHLIIIRLPWSWIMGDKSVKRTLANNRWMNHMKNWCVYKICQYAGTIFSNIMVSGVILFWIVKDSCVLTYFIKVSLFICLHFNSCSPHYAIFLHVKPWILGCAKSIFMEVINKWRSSLYKSACARIIDEYDVTMPVPRVRVTSQCLARKDRP